MLPGAQRASDEPRNVELIRMVVGAIAERPLMPIHYRVLARKPS